MTLLTRSFALSLALSAAVLGSAQSRVYAFVGPEIRTTTSHDAVIGSSFSDHYGSSSVGGSFQASFRSAKLNAVANTVKGTGGSLTSRVEIDDRFTVTGGTGIGVMFVNLRVHGDAGAAHYGDIETGGYARGSLGFDLHTDAVDYYPGSIFDDYSFNWYKSASAGPSGTHRIEQANSTYYASPDYTSFTSKEYDPNAGYYQLPIKFRFDTPWEMSLSAWVEVSNLHSGVSFADFGNTFQWLGIDSFASVNADGTLTPMTGASIQSLSGTNYAEAVPEPTSMLALGAGALALLRRRRK